MDAIVMAGGKGSRMRPLAAYPIPKHLVPVGGKPLIWHVLQRVIEGGATRIIISLNGPRPEQTILTVTDFDLGVPITFNHSSCDVSGGPARDLELLQPWVTPRQDLILMLADSLFFTKLDLVKPRAPHIWTMNLDQGDDPSRYGQVECNGDQVTRIWEKPEYQQSQIIQTGIWKLPYDVFDRALSFCSQVEREAHIGDVTKQYVEAGMMTHTRLPNSSYLDCGTSQAYQTACERMPHV